ncbi:MAG: glycosyltransferase [Bacteroidetes bacterium]|nr:glycosyltransferase [Bacteroidota bacterium]
MIEAILLTLLALTTLFYFFFLTRVHIGLCRLTQHSPRLQGYPFISVIIAARNEETTIGQCLHSVLTQEYPINRFEVIVVDDHSTDHTVQRVQDLQRGYSNLKLLHNNNSGKTSAITLGISKARGEIIATTDADCTVTPQWLLRIASHFREGTVLVAGPVVYDNSPTRGSPLTDFDRIELLGLVTVAAGLIGVGRPIICNGANLAYKKSTFLLVGGFGTSSVDNDDELLMSRFLEKNLGTIDFMWEPDALVTTKQMNTLRSFLFQRIRWASKKGHYNDRTVFIELTLLYFFFASLFINLLVGFLWDTMVLLPVGLAYGGKIILDYFTLRLGADLWKQHLPIPMFFLAEIFHVPYIVIVACIAQCISIRWKGRIKTCESTC